MKLRVTMLALASTLVAGPPPARAAEEAKHPAGNTVERAVHVCAACHGEGGRSSSPAFPSLAGQMPQYFAAQLKDFREQKRAESDIQAYMWGVSALLDDATIDGLARYFAEQTPAPGRAGDASLMSAGKEIFEHGLPARNVRPCTQCHGAHGEGAAVFPRLAGQHADYLLRQLKVFRTRLRPHGVLMKNETSELSDAELRALATYIQSL